MQKSFPGLHESYVMSEEGLQIEILASHQQEARIPLIFLPPILGTAAMFAERMEALRPHWGISYSPRGCGRSSCPEEGAFSFAQRLAELEAIIAHFQLKEYSLYAFSRAVPLAAAHALKHPKAVRGMIWEGGEPRQAPLDDAWLESMQKAQLLWVNPRALELYRKESESLDFYPQLAQLTMPILILRGAKSDSFLSSAMSSNLLRLLPKAQEHILAHSEHGIAQEDFYDSMAKIKLFLATQKAN